MLESALTKSIMKKLRGKGGFWIKIHGGPFQVLGIPDIIGCYQGRFCAFEVKRPGRDLTPIQAATIQMIKKAGGVALKITSFEEAEAALRTVPELE